MSAMCSCLTRSNHTTQVIEHNLVVLLGSTLYSNIRSTSEPSLLYAVLQQKLRRSSSRFPLDHFSCSCMGPDLSDKLCRRAL